MTPIRPWVRRYVFIAENRDHAHGRTKKDTEQVQSWYKQVGNAVPPLAAKQLGVAILEAALGRGVARGCIPTPWAD